MNKLTLVRLFLILLWGFLFQINFVDAETQKKLRSSQEQETSNQSDEHGHNHGEEKASTKDHKEDDHDDHDEHGHHDEEEGEEGGSPAVGPDKGILEKGEQGFKLAPEAILSFELKMQKAFSGAAEYPRATLVEVKDQQFVYCVRNGWFKRTTVNVIKKNKDTVFLEIPSATAGDMVIIKGTGFVRVSELVAEEGVSHGHSH